MIAGQIAMLEWLVRIAAGVGGAVLGYVISGPVIRVLYRLVFQRPVPGWLLPLGKLASGALLGALLFYLVSLGGSGWGWGGNDGLGLGAGPGTGKTGKDNGKRAKSTGAAPARERLDIELLGGAEVRDGRYYLLDRQPPAKTLAEVETAIKDQADQVEVHVMLADESVARSHPAFARLQTLLREYRIPTVEPREK